MKSKINEIKVPTYLKQQNHKQWRLYGAVPHKK
jgi:hypothetical protein